MEIGWTALLEPFYLTRTEEEAFKLKDNFGTKTNGYKKKLL